MAKVTLENEWHNPTTHLAGNTWLTTKKQKLKPYNVLGAVEDYENQILQATPPPPPLPEETVDMVDPTTLPTDIYQAASAAADKGVAIISSFRELQVERKNLQDQLESMQTTQDAAILGSTMLDASTTKRQGLLAGQVQQEAAREQRMLERWHKQQRIWQQQAAKLAATTTRPGQELAMTRGEEWRSREETLALLRQSMPPEHSGLHPAVWAMSLREGWERYVPVGNTFSGLYVCIRENLHHARPRQVTKVAKPAAVKAIDVLGSPKASLRLPALEAPPSPSRQRLWADAPWLANRKEDYGPSIQRVQPSAGGMESLLLAGSGLDGTLREAAARDISLQDVEAHMAATNPSAFLAWLDTKAALKEQQQAAAREQEEAAIAAATEAASQAPTPGPCLQFDTDRLALSTRTGVPATATLQVSNKGTTAVQYRWQRRLPDALPVSSSRPATTAQAAFYMSDMHGVMLPGDTRDFRFMFQARQAGMWTELWQLVAVPELPQAVPVLTVRGVAVDDLAGPSQPAAALQQKLAEREKERKVQAALERIVRGISTPRCTSPVRTAPEQQEQETFDRGNVTSWPPIFYTPQVYADGRAIYSAAWAILEEARLAEIEAKAKKAKPKKGEEVVEPPGLPAQWDGSLTTLHTVLEQLHNSQPETAAGLREQLSRAQADAAVPVSRGVILRHAMRLQMLEAAEAIGEDMERISAEALASAAAVPTSREPSVTGAAALTPPAPELTPSALAAAAAAAKAALNAARTEAVHKQLVKAINGLQDCMAKDRGAIAQVLDGKLAQASTQLQEADSKEELLWEKFALLRHRKFLGCTP